jgi:hypothetical protein
MLSKCANPICHTTFRYLSEGKLYLIDSKASVVRRGTQAEPKHAIRSFIYEYFWLCSSCCRDMTIEIDSDYEIRVVLKGVTAQDSDLGCQPASISTNISAA